MTWISVLHPEYGRLSVINSYTSNQIVKSISSRFQDGKVGHTNNVQPKAHTSVSKLDLMYASGLTSSGAIQRGLPRRPPMVVVAPSVSVCD